ncbi:hypothetical protein Hanom_Chr08g00726031 [Helianthus anomalus]
MLTLFWLFTIYIMCIHWYYDIGASIDALDSVPMALEENSGLQRMETLSAMKAHQIKVFMIVVSSMVL